ncbi:unnamed protein product [Oncorhynchus mykiss]|uniref:Uncharacterized protein n=1 Tax=Oncorhynchus mykiss TaxID=8022 RepID=A0A060W9L1_ONCMY|nr:unnamed protein product [Oncorhynchus mykiss]
MLTGNVYWKRFLDVLRKAYTPPTRHALSTNLLDAEVQVKVNQIIEKADCISIISAGWWNVREQGIINYISTPQPSLFYPLCSVCCTHQFILKLPGTNVPWSPLCMLLILSSILSFSPPVSSPCKLTLTLPGLPPF